MTVARLMPTEYLQATSFNPMPHGMLDRRMRKVMIKADKETQSLHMNGDWKLWLKLLFVDSVFHENQWELSRSLNLIEVRHYFYSNIIFFQDGYKGLYMIKAG